MTHLITIAAGVGLWLTVRTVFGLLNWWPYKR